MNDKNLFNEQREQLMVHTTLITKLVPRQSTGNKFSMWEETVPPLAGPPPHSHKDEEVFYVLAGEFEFMLNDPANTVHATAGAVMHIPSYNLHTYRNIGKGAGKLITLATPGLLEDYFEAVGNKVRVVEDIPEMDIEPDYSKLDASKLISMAAQYSVNFQL